MTSLLAQAIHEVEPPRTKRAREQERILADSIADQATVIVRLSDGTEISLTPEDVVALVALVAARAEGQRVSVIAHDSLITPSQAANLLGVSRPMVYRFIERGDIKAIRVGSHWRMTARDVLQLAARRRAALASFDAGFAAALQAGKEATERRGGPAVGDAKTTWQSSTEQQKAAALAVARAIIEER